MSSSSTLLLSGGINGHHMARHFSAMIISILLIAFAGKRSSPSSLRLRHRIMRRQLMAIMRSVFRDICQQSTSCALSCAHEALRPKASSLRPALSMPLFTTVASCRREITDSVLAASWHRFIYFRRRRNTKLQARSWRWQSPMLYSAASSDTSEVVTSPRA